MYFKLTTCFPVSTTVGLSGFAGAENMHKKPYRFIILTPLASVKKKNLLNKRNKAKTSVAVVVQRLYYYIGLLKVKALL